MEDTYELVFDGAHKLLAEGTVHVLEHIKFNCCRIMGYQMDAASGTMAPAGMKGAAPGLNGVMNSVAKSVLYTVEERVRHWFPRVPHLRSVCTDAVFELRSFWRQWMVPYVISLYISEIMGFLKLLMRLLMALATMVGGEELNNN